MLGGYHLQVVGEACLIGEFHSSHVYSDSE